MAASLGGAFKQLVEAGGLGLSAYRDNASKSATEATWVTISERISTTRVPSGDGGADDPLTELVQIDLWQPWRALSPGDPAEDYTLADQLYSLLNGCTLTSPPMPVRSVVVDDVRRFVEEDSNLVHDAFTVRVARDAAA